MFPPVEQKVLQDNPDFASLYRVLTTTILNPDGSTKDDPEAKERIAVEKNLAKHRQKEAKHRLLRHTIATVTAPEMKPTASATATLPRPGDRRQRGHEQNAQVSLPEPLLDLLLILPPFLDAANSLPPDSAALLLSSPPLSNLEFLLPQLTELISADLHATALGLARLTHPSTNPSYLHRHISSLPQDFANIKSSLSAAEQCLISARLRTVASLTDLLRTYSDCLMCLIRSLEAKHGVIARSLELRASDISLEAQHSEKQAEQMMCRLRKEIFSPPVVVALESYMAHLKDARFRTAEIVKGLERELTAYGSGIDDETGESKEKVMKEMARAYKELDRQMEDAKQDLDRLQLS